MLPLLAGRRCELPAELCDQPVLGGIERVMRFPSGEIERVPTVHLARRDLVPDGFLGARHRLADGRAHALVFATTS